MPTPRIYSSTTLEAEQIITLDESARRHAVQVLRLKQGAPITLFDGRGGEFPATIQQIERKRVTVALQQKIDHSCESPLAIDLYQGISKGERMDYAVQKATELGVSSITPLFCERTVVKLDPKRLQKRLEHWQAVAISACEQCGRNRIPTIHPPENLQQITTEKDVSHFLLNPATGKGFKEYSTPTHSTSILIGPEGGLSEEEIQHATDQGWQSIQLGPRVLRTETATVVALTALQQLWGDL